VGDKILTLHMFVPEAVHRTGIRTDSLAIMSGYRTPWYNRAIGNWPKSSRHVYGGAADIFIDVNPRDGQMDDLNHDGKINKNDADYLYDLLQSWTTEPWWKPLIGGMVFIPLQGNRRAMNQRLIDARTQLVSTLNKEEWEQIFKMENLDREEE
jgi:hypothetical protein